MDVLSTGKKENGKKCLSAEAPSWVPCLTPKIISEQKDELEKKLSHVNRQLMDSKADAVRLEQRSEWLEKRNLSFCREINGLKASYKKKDDLRDKEMAELQEQNNRLRRRARLALEMEAKVQEELRLERKGHMDEMGNLKEERDSLERNTRTLCHDIGNLQQIVNQLNEQLRQGVGWISHSLKVKCIFDEMKKSSVLPEDHADWVYPMVEDIEIPHEAFTSNEDWTGRYLKFNFILDEVYKIGAIPDVHLNWINDMRSSIIVPQIAHHIKRRYLPSYEDAQFQDDGDEYEQADRIEEWTREARSINLSEHFTERLVEDRPRVVSLVSRIQGLVRGHQTRTRLLRIYGRDPVERNRVVTLIQKILRGYLVRASSFRNFATLGNFTYESREGSMFSMLQRPLHSARVGIRFVNTGLQTIDFAWVRQDGSTGRSTRISPRTYTTTNISSFVTHSFIIASVTGYKFIRIPRFFKSGTVIDLNTGITFGNEHWDEIRERYENRALEYQQTQSDEINGTPLSIMCHCDRCRERREGEREEKEEEERIQLAIMLSLEETPPPMPPPSPQQSPQQSPPPSQQQSFTIDVIDYSDTLINILNEE